MPLFLALMSVSVVNVALPAIESGLDATSADLQWVLAGYTLTFGTVLVAAGRAGDLWGRKNLFLAGITLYMLGSLLSGLAGDTLLLNAGRLLTGLGAGVFNPRSSGSSSRTSTAAPAGGPTGSSAPWWASAWPWGPCSAGCSSARSAPSGAGAPRSS